MICDTIPQLLGNMKFVEHAEAVHNPCPNTSGKDLKLSRSVANSRHPRGRISVVEHLNVRPYRLQLGALWDLEAVHNPCPNTSGKDLK